MNREKDEWELKFDALSDRAIARLREIVTLSPMARVEVLFSHRIIHVTDCGNLEGQSSAFPASVSIAIHLAKSDIEPTTTSLSVTNAVDPTPVQVKELNRLVLELGAVAQVACADKELTDIGIALQQVEIDRRADFMRRENERVEMVLRLRERQEREREVRKTAERLEEQRQKAVLRLQRVDARLRDLKPEQP